MKLMLRISMLFVFTFHLYLVQCGFVSWYAGLWGFVMQVLHHQFVSDLPNVGFGSPILWTIFVGTFVHEILWFTNLPDRHLDSLLHDKCACFETDLLPGVPLCFCTGTISALVICVWMVPFLLLLSCLPDEKILLQSGPRRRSPSAFC
uniref:Uncharacterized protein n=1 Tax=Cryptomonas curvata TaxID=233186 RepID=A0A7S0QBU0_9CRYP|mmetsp:Transcript_1422/g.2962  ORF Transcript_1422/g.2962 Transcript_1422/m.2962 type:complete len:148 (+) Transcript_1422:257-700(+)